MRRNLQPTEETAQDSFLDVVANLVGVIIILVMLVGTKSAHDLIYEKGLVLSQPSDSSLLADVNLLRSQVTKARKTVVLGKEKVIKLAQQITRINGEIESFEQRRVELAMHRKIVEEDMARREQELTESQKSEFETQRRIVTAKLRLEELTKEQLAHLATASEVEEVECVPTPLARGTEDEPIHLRVIHGRISIVPMNELFEEALSHYDEIRRRIQQRDDLVETFGPIENYRLRMHLKRIKPHATSGPRAGQVERTTIEEFFQILPINSDLGFDVEAAFTAGSDIHRYLVSQRRNTTSVVVWLYTDSFDKSNQIKRFLWELGYTIDTRPMEPEDNITISPYGSRAAVQ